MTRDAQSADKLTAPLRPRPYLLAKEIPPLLAQPSRRSRNLPIRQFVKDWFSSLADHAHMIADPLPPQCPAGDAVRIATTVHALCDQEGIEPPEWVFDHRFEVDEMLHEVVSWDGEMAVWAREHAPPACKWHRCWFESSFLEVIGVHYAVREARDDL